MTVDREALLWAREQAALRSEAVGEPIVANLWRSGMHDDLPDIRMRVEAYLAGSTRLAHSTPSGMGAREIADRLFQLIGFHRDDLSPGAVRDFQQLGNDLRESALGSAGRGDKG